MIPHKTYTADDILSLIKQALDEPSCQVTGVETDFGGLAELLKVKLSVQDHLKTDLTLTIIRKKATE